jgi:hypothetical protein
VLDAPCKSKARQPPSLNANWRFSLHLLAVEEMLHLPPFSSLLSHTSCLDNSAVGRSSIPLFLYIPIAPYPSVSSSCARTGNRLLCSIHLGSASDLSHPRNRSVLRLTSPHLTSTQTSSLTTVLDHRSTLLTSPRNPPVERDRDLRVQGLLPFLDGRQWDMHSKAN